MTNNKLRLSIALLGLYCVATPAIAQSTDPSLGRHLSETICSECHQIDAASPDPGPGSGAPSFVAISAMPSMTELAIKVFLRSSHPTMPNIILSPEEIDSLAAYIQGLKRGEPRE
jgi:mono/diheme cytochrome c family protein